MNATAASEAVYQAQVHPGVSTATVDGGILILGNGSFEQRWHFVGGRPALQSFSYGPAEWNFVDPEADSPVEPTSFDLVTRHGRVHPAQAESLEAIVTLCPTADKTRIRYRFQIFSGLIGCIVTRLSDTESPLGDPRDPVFFESLAPLRLHRPHCEVEEVHFAEQTDLFSEMVQTSQWQLHPSTHRIASRCNLLSIADPVNGEGLTFLLLAPSRLVRENWSADADFEITRRPLTQGYATRLEIRPGDYPVAVLGFCGGHAGRRRVLHGLQKQLHQYDASRDGLVLSNTWGDRGCAEKLCDAFLAKEVAAGSRLGVEVLQIDDGWQKGETINTIKTGGIWSDFWKDETFWQPHPGRFPDGLAPTMHAIKEAHLLPGLWFAPDSSDHFANWQKDVRVLLGLYRDYGVRHFKLDGMSIESPLGERRVLALLEELHRASNGEILADMDTTAQLRLGYWGHTSGSTIFLQNRYTDHGVYHPHQTLRAIWSLCPYFHPSRLRMEFLNNARKDQRYGSDPLRPSLYPPETLFAITIPTSPLAWMELSQLEEDFIQRVAPLVAQWKTHRAAWALGDVSPLGQKPNGYTWTGFLLVEPDQQAQQVLVFRENSPEQSTDFQLPIPAAIRMETLGGRGMAEVSGSTLFVKIPDPFGFLWIRLG